MSNSAMSLHWVAEDTSDILVLRARKLGALLGGAFMYGSIRKGLTNSDGIIFDRATGAVRFETTKAEDSY